MTVAAAAALTTCPFTGWQQIGKQSLLRADAKAG